MLEEGLAVRPLPGEGRCLTLPSACAVTPLRHLARTCCCQQRQLPVFEEKILQKAPEDLCTPVSLARVDGGVQVKHTRGLCVRPNARRLRN